MSKRSRRPTAGSTTPASSKPPGLSFGRLVFVAPMLSSVLLLDAACASAPLKDLPRNLDCPAPAIASIRGVVKTRSGQPIANATVTFPGYDSTTTLETDSEGYFLLACVVPGGGYDVRVEAPGFQSQRFEGLEASVPATELRITLRAAK